MKIHVSRSGTSFGPYDELDAKAMYSRGNIVATDLVWHDGLAEWQPAERVFGAPVSTTPPVVPPMAPPLVPPASQQPFQAHPMSGHAAPQNVHSGNSLPQGLPLPPKLHWGLVLLFSVLTLGIFPLVWIFIQSSWVRRIDARSNATMYLVAYLLMVLLGGAMTAADSDGVKGLGVLIYLGSTVFFYCAYYSMRRSMIDYYNSIEPIALRLSGVMMFFFHIVYLQHHMTRIAEWKLTGVLRPQ